MPITTIDGARNGMQYEHTFVKAVSGTLALDRPFSTFYQDGSPPLAPAPSPGLAGAALTSYTGQIPFVNPVSGEAYFGRMRMASGSFQQVLLCDRLWHNSGITITQTTAHTINSVAWPARDVAGSTNGNGIYIGVEVSAATGAGTPTLTIGYTNEAGTAGRTGTNIIPTVASSIVGNFFPIGLQAGDLGVRSVQNFTLSATWTSGTIHLVAFRILARLVLPLTNIPSEIDWVTACGVRLYNDTVPFIILVPGATTASAPTGHVAFTQG